MGKEQIKSALQLAGAEHKFQKTLVLLICISWMVINFILLGSTLIYMDPVFNCGGDKQTRYYESEACSRQDCVLVDQFTITAELELYCDLEWARDMIQSIFSLGSFAGLIVMNLISDTKGRKISTLISLGLSIFGVILALVGGLTKVIPLLILSQFFGGFGAYSIVTLSYTLLSDFCSDDFRPRAVVIINSAWGFSTAALGVFYLVEINWMPFLLYMVLIPLVLVCAAMLKFIQQSPYILINQNKKYDALQVLSKIAILNGRSQSIAQIRELVQNNGQIQQKTKPSLKNVFKIMKEWVYFKPILLLTLIYGIGNINFYGISYSFDMEGLGFGINSIIAGCVEMVSFVYLNKAVNVLPRKKGISGFYLLVFFIGMLFLTSWVQDNYVVGTFLLGVSRIFSTISYTLIACMQTEAFTVQIQSTALGFIEAFSLYGAFLAPLIVDLSDKIGINSIALISICVSFAIWPTFFLKQTLVKKTRPNQEQTKTDPLLDSLLTNNPEEISSQKRGPQSSSTLNLEEEECN